MTIPDYPDRRPLLLTDKELLDRAFDRLQPVISELTFAGLYLFRHPHAYQLAAVGDSLVVLGTSYSGVPRFLPPLSGDTVAAARLLLHAGETLYGADEKLAGRLASDTSLQIIEDRDSFDYLYLRQELAELPGNRYHKKKNRINYFAARHDNRVERYTSAHLTGCGRLLDQWQEAHPGTASTSGAGEAAATRQALELFEPLGLEGLVVLVDGEVAAFALGERLNRSTAVCHFEKANIFMEGASQLVNREFSRLFPDCTFVNREQDLGEPGLRSAKLSYHPVELVKKFHIRAG